LTSSADNLKQVYDLLYDAFGPQRWWPADSRTEVVIGAILTQNTAWKNVERAMTNLRVAGMISFERLYQLDVDDLAALIRPAGTFRVKAGRLKAFVDVLMESHGGDLDRMLDDDLDAARRRLLAIPGIGPETADAILLYAGNRPSFVVDAYTRRILARHHLVDRRAHYERIRRLFMDSLEPDVEKFNEYHALLVELGKRHCRTRAFCDGCPLAHLPHDESI